MADSIFCRMIKLEKKLSPKSHRYRQHKPFCRLSVLTKPELTRIIHDNEGQFW
jgi:hypothetical protein